jgi:hypothetical protein
LLSYETINQIHTLLDNGFSQRKTAKLADVSVSTVQRIANGKRPNIGRLDCFTTLVNSEHYIPVFPLELHGDLCAVISIFVIKK